MKKIILLYILSSLTFISFSKDKESKKDTNPNNYDLVYVSGNVSDYFTGESLVGVEVQIEGSNQKTYTDFDGNFLFEDIRTGEYNICINYISYKNTTLEKQKIELYPEPINIKIEPEN